jgi:hypothetical protein
LAQIQKLDAPLEVAARDDDPNPFLMPARLVEIEPTEPLLP